MARDVWTKAFGIESRPPWFVDRSRGGGMWLMNGAHMIDRSCWVLGSGVAAVRGWVGNPIHNAAADDASVAYLHLKNGLTATLFHAGFKERGNDQCGVEIVLTDGMIEFDSYATASRSPATAATRPSEIERVNPFVVEFARMVDSITTGAPLAVPAAWARHIVAVMLAVEESGRLGREITDLRRRLRRSGLSTNETMLLPAPFAPDDDPTPRRRFPLSRVPSAPRRLAGAGIRASIRTLKRRLGRRGRKPAASSLVGAITAAETALRAVEEAALVVARPDTADHPGYDLALVLSGGGARGFAHVGVLEVVEELQLPVDLVVGVSMGSIIGAGYAAGLSANEMADLARAMRISSIFRPRPGRLNLVDPAGIRAVISRIFGDLPLRGSGARVRRRQQQPDDRRARRDPRRPDRGRHRVKLLDPAGLPAGQPRRPSPAGRRPDRRPPDRRRARPRRQADRRRRRLDPRPPRPPPAGRPPRHARRRPHPGSSPAARDLDAVRIFSRVLHHATLTPARPPVELLIRPAFGRRSTLHYHRWSDMVACGRAAAEAARPALAALLTPDS